MQNKKQRKTYSPEFKTKVVETMLQEHWSQKQTARNFGIPDHKTVKRWKEIYLTEGAQGFRIDHAAIARAKVPTKPKEVIVDKNTLEELEYLRAEVAYLKKLNALVAEKERHEKNHG